MTKATIDDDVITLNSAMTLDFIPWYAFSGITAVEVEIPAGTRLSALDGDANYFFCSCLDRSVEREAVRAFGGDEAVEEYDAVENSQLSSYCFVVPRSVLQEETNA